MATTPAGPLYVCVTETGGVRREAPIEFPPNVGALCAKHPEMEPSGIRAQRLPEQRWARLRRRRGRNWTLQMEAEYDWKVIRVRIK